MGAKLHERNFITSARGRNLRDAAENAIIAGVNKIRKISAVLILALFALVPPVHSADVGKIPPPEIAAKSHILMDFHTGEILAEHNADLRLPPASLTKIMTAHLVFDAIANRQIASDTQTLVSEQAWAAKVTGSKTFIEVNTEVSVRDLVYGVIVQSGNDAALALAELISGDEKNFARLMNAAAKRIGLQNSQFQNATGLPHPQHYSSARDMALLTRSAIAEFPEEYKIYAEPEFTYNNITQRNRNGLLTKYDGADGVKTGHTREAGYCLVASAERQGRRLIAVVMGAKSPRERERESVKLLNYGFQNFVNLDLFDANKLREVKLWKGEKETMRVRVEAETGAMTLPRDVARRARAVFISNTPHIAPVAEGDPMGAVEVIDGDDERIIARHKVVAAESVDEGGFLTRLKDEAKLRLGKGHIHNDDAKFLEW